MWTEWETEAGDTLGEILTEIKPTDKYENRFEQTDIERRIDE